MSDLKYGHLYTADDMVRFGQTVAETRGLTTEQVQKALSRFQGRFPPDEPLVLLRGQDIVSPDALYDYLDHCRSVGAQTDHLDCIQKSIDMFDKWQKEHPDRIKVPDTDASYADRIS